MAFNILVINPGAGSTRTALFTDEKPIFEENIRHNPEELLKFPRMKNSSSFPGSLINTAFVRKRLCSYLNPRKSI